MIARSNLFLTNSLNLLLDLSSKKKRILFMTFQILIILLFKLCFLVISVMSQFGKMELSSPNIPNLRTFIELIYALRSDKTIFQVQKLIN